MMTPIERQEAQRIEFQPENNNVSPIVLQKQDVQDIIRSCDSPPLEPEMSEEKAEGAKTITATLYVYGPVFDLRAQNWRFRYMKKPIYADIRETDIAKEAVRRGGAFMNDRYRVRMEVTPSDTKDGTPHYKITEVLDFTPAEQQQQLALRRPRKPPAKKKRR